MTHSIRLLAALSVWVLAGAPGLAADMEYVPCCSDLSRPTRPFAEPYTGPLIDTHAHLGGRVPEDSYFDSMAQLVDGGTVDGLILMPTPNYGLKGNHQELFAAVRGLEPRTSGRTKVLCGANYTNHWMAEASVTGFTANQVETLKRRLQGNLESGGCLGYGEIAIRHYDKYNDDDPRGAQPELVVPFDFQPLHGFLSVANRLGKPIDLHIEPMTKRGVSHQAEWIKEVQSLAETYTRSVIVLSHTAMTRPENLRRILERYPNVHTNIKLTTGNTPWTNLEPPNSRRRLELYEDWAKLFEDMPERFMVGSDFKFNKTKRNGRAKGTGEYINDIRHIRNVLGSLAAKAAQAIAHGNARRIFGF